MAMARYVLLTLLALVLILPAGFVLSPAVVAEDEQPGEGAGGVPVRSGPPQVAGTYTGKCSTTIFLWDGEKVRWSGELVIEISQSASAVRVLWYLPGFSETVKAKARDSQLPQKSPGDLLWPTGDYNGWVEELYVDSVSGKPKNKPLLTAARFESYDPDQGAFSAWHLTATVKLDKDRNVKSIKGTISASVWQGQPYRGAHSNAKFTVTPE